MAKMGQAEQAATAARSLVMTMPSDPAPEDDPPADEADERELARRSNNPPLSPWLVLGLILMVSVGVYVVSALI